MLKKYFLITCYRNDEFISGQKSSTTQWCITSREKVKMYFFTMLSSFSDYTQSILNCPRGEVLSCKVLQIKGPYVSVECNSDVTGRGLIHQEGEIWKGLYNY